MQGSLAELREKLGEYTPIWRIKDDIWTDERHLVLVKPSKKESPDQNRNAPQANEARRRRTQRVRSGVKFIEPDSRTDSAKLRKQKLVAAKKYMDSIKAQVKALIETGKQVEVKVLVNELEYNL